MSDGILVLNTAPFSAPGEFTVVDETGAEETVTNMTTDATAAGPDDILVTDNPAGTAPLSGGAIKITKIGGIHNGN